LRLTKTNGCGNSMMATSSVSQPILPPPPLPAAAGAAQQAQAQAPVAVAATSPTAQSMSCQDLSDKYAVVANKGWGFSPADARTAWAAKNCQTSPGPSHVAALCQQMSDSYGVSANVTWGKADNN